MREDGCYYRGTPYWPSGERTWTWDVRFLVNRTVSVTRTDELSLALTVHDVSLEMSGLRSLMFL